MGLEEVYQDYLLICFNISSNGHDINQFLGSEGSFRLMVFQRCAAVRYSSATKSGSWNRTVFELRTVATSSDLRMPGQAWVIPV